MKYKFAHFNFNVANIEASKKFYAEALDLYETHRIETADGSFLIVYLGDRKSGFELELTELKNHPQRYDLGENEFHLALQTDDMASSLAKHRAMNCVCFENPEMGIYFIEDPDGYWIEIIPQSEKI